MRIIAATDTNGMQREPAMSGIEEGKELGRYLKITAPLHRMAELPQSGPSARAAPRIAN